MNSIRIKKGVRSGNKVYKKPSVKCHENIEIWNVDDGIGVNLTEKTDYLPKAYRPHNHYKTGWVVFPVEQAEQIVELLKERIKFHKERYGNE